MKYKGERTREISFPLGGIGSGCIGLAGNGQLIDWEIFNKPNKGGDNGFSHFAVKAERSGKTIDARVLHGDYIGTYTGIYSGTSDKFGGGLPRFSLAGLPHFEDTEFIGEFPVAEMNFADKSFPGLVKMTAFNPFIPTNDKDSSIPAAFFELTIKNTTDDPIDYTFCLTVANPLPKEGAYNEYSEPGGLKLIQLGNNKLDVKNLEYGDLCFATDSSDVSFKEYLYRGSWFDIMGIFWREFILPGKLVNKRHPREDDRHFGELGSLAAHIGIAPGDEKTIRFILTWNFPNCANYWNPVPDASGDEIDCGCEDGCCGDTDESDFEDTWKNYYAVLFKDSAESAIYSLKNWDRLKNETLLFKNALFSSTMPDYVLDAISANISILKAATCLRLENGEFYGWEGCFCNSGCCEGSCTHVWNYAYALPYLFPALERSMRDIDYEYNQREDGSMSFRLQLPLGREAGTFRACCDGQFGNVIKTYRDWKISGDNDWLGKKWPAVKRAIDFAWHKDNSDRWDPDKTGVLWGIQHNTLDIEFFEPNAWLTGFYLGALKAGSEMAAVMGDDASAKEYMEIFERGKKYVDENLFNGKYYFQKIDVTDKTVLERYKDVEGINYDALMDFYWNSEGGEIKFQMGDGAASDQLLGQWHANLSGLGELFDKEKVKIALENTFKINYKKRLRDHFNPCRIYALNDESGVVICDWPEGTHRPLSTAVYSEECWPGIEYSLAALMIQEGLVDTGLAIVKAVRERFTGVFRNPWNEFECGSNYARSMSSYSLLNALCGFTCDMVKKEISFIPAVDSGDCEFFFSLGSGWGVLKRSGKTYSVTVLYGSLELGSLRLPVDCTPVSVDVNNSSKSFSIDKNRIIFSGNITLNPNDDLVISVT